MRKQSFLFISSFLFIAYTSFGAALDEGDPEEVSLGTAVSASASAPVVSAHAGAGGDHSDAVSVLSDHDSDDEAFRALITEARELHLSGDPTVKRNLRGKRHQRKVDIESRSKAERDARRATFLAKIGEPAKVKEGLGGATSSAASIVPIPRAVPTIATGHEAIYQRFLRGIFVYKPNEDNEMGRIELPIAALVDPLSGTFELAACGDVGKYISIHTGYKKAKIPANKSKLEIWICPKFLVERELATSAAYFGRIIHQWESPIAYFWTLGEKDVATDNYGYLLHQDACMDKALNIYEKWRVAQHAPERKSGLDSSLETQRPGYRLSFTQLARRMYFVFNE